MVFMNFVAVKQPLEDTHVWGHLNNQKANQVCNDDKSFHEWYRFVLSYPPHLVRGYFENFDLKKGSLVLDPFCGTGTTIVEAKKQNFFGLGIEANPLPCFASKTKTNWSLPPEELASVIDKVKKVAFENASSKKIKTLNDDKNNLLLKNSLLPKTMHEALSLLEAIDQFSRHPAYDHMRLAFAKSIVFSSSNLRFGPEVGLGKVHEYKPVIEPWVVEAEKILDDLKTLDHRKSGQAAIIYGDARSMNSQIRFNSVDAVITSPPYPNEKDYTRTTRLESVLLGFINSKEELRKTKKQLVRSNTRGVYVDDTDHILIQDIPQIKTLSKAIEERRIELGKTSGFERMYHKVTEAYFGGMANHLNNLKPYLKKGAQLAYVVGDQASYFQILIPTGQLLAEIAERLGYKVKRIDLFRTRFATATRKELREEVVILEWQGQ